MTQSGHNLQTISFSDTPNVKQDTDPSPIGAGVGCDPPISGGFPPPPHPKEEFPSPPSSAQFGNSSDDLADMDTELEGDGFTLSRLLGAEPSPNPSWDCLSLGSTGAPPTSQASLDGASGLDTPPTSQTSRGGLDTPPTPDTYDQPEQCVQQIKSEGVEFETTQENLTTMENVSTLGYETPPSVSHSFDTSITKSVPSFSSSETPYIKAENNTTSYNNMMSTTTTISTTTTSSTSGGSSPADSTLQPSQQECSQPPAGYRPWEAEQQQQQQQQAAHPDQHRGQEQLHQHQHGYGHQQLHTHHNQGSYNGHSQNTAPNQTKQSCLPSFTPNLNLSSYQCEFDYRELVPPPNTQAPPSHPLPPTSRNVMTHMTGRYTVVHGGGPGGLPGGLPAQQQPHVSAMVPQPKHQIFQQNEGNQYNSSMSPNKFPHGRVIAKARRPSSHHQLINQQQQLTAALSPGQPCSPTQILPDVPYRPSSASSLTDASTTSTHPPTPTPTSPTSLHYTLLTEARSKGRATSLEGSESDRSQRSDSADTPLPGSGDCGQVAAISSTDPTPETISGLAEVFKPPADQSLGSPSVGGADGTNTMPADTQEKSVKKKRKRCGECVGCARKDNCGDCAPCRNDKSHQICKMRRCEALTEKKVKPRKSSNLSANGENGGSNRSTGQNKRTANPSSASSKSSTTTAVIGHGDVTSPWPTNQPSQSLDPWSSSKPSMGPPPQVTVSTGVVQPVTSVVVAPVTTLTFDTAYNFPPAGGHTAPLGGGYTGVNNTTSLHHGTTLTDFFHQQDGYRGGYLDQTLGVPGYQHQVAPAGATNTHQINMNGYHQNRSAPAYRPHHNTAGYRLNTAPTGYPGNIRTTGLTSPHHHYPSTPSPHQPLHSPHLPLLSPHHQSLPSPQHPLPSPQHPIPSPQHHHPVPSPQHHQPLPSPHHQPVPSPQQHHPLPSPRPYGGNPTPSPGHTTLPSPAAGQSKQGTPLPSPAPVNDEYQVTSTRSPGGAVNTDNTSGQPDQQQQQQQMPPVYTLLPPAHILTSADNYSQHKYNSIYTQDSFIHLNFQ